MSIHLVCSNKNGFCFHLFAWIWKRRRVVKLQLRSLCLLLISLMRPYDNSCVLFTHIRSYIYRHCIVVVVILLHSQITIKRNNFSLVRMSSCLNDFYVVFCSARIDNDESDSSIFGRFSHQQKALNDSVYPIFDK